MGGDVQLTWVTPVNTTDGDKIRRQITAAICREVLQTGAGSGAKPGTCDLVARIAVTSGPAQLIDPLPPGLNAGEPKLMAYRVELLNDHGRSAGRSDAVYAVGGEAPAPVAALTIRPRREATLIQWQPSRSIANGTMEVRRTLTAVAGGPVLPRAERDAGSARSTRPPAGALKGTSPKSSGGTQASEVTLTEAATAKNGDSGGMLDPTVHDAESYLYVAQRVRKVTLAGRELELRGLASSPISFVYRDTFPPQAPMALVCVPGGGLGAAPSIDLSWEPTPESDLLGYNVYRREEGGAFVKLTAQPVPSPAFRDLEVAPGRKYIYRVTAVDRRHNESSPGAEVSESPRQ